MKTVEKTRKFVSSTLLNRTYLRAFRYPITKGIVIFTWSFLLTGCTPKETAIDQDKPTRRDFYILDEKPLHYSDVKRFQVYITIDTDSTNRDRIKRALEDLVQTYVESKREFDALAILAYKPDDEQKVGEIAYTLAKGIYAPNGKWGDAHKDAKKELNIEFFD